MTEQNHSSYPLEAYMPQTFSAHLKESFPDYNNYSYQEPCDSITLDKKPFFLVMPPPNVTGMLHMGHALTYTLQDAYVRFQRLLGAPVLMQPGVDHAGIALQMMVTRALEEAGEKPQTLSREHLTKEAWRYKELTHERISEQMKSLALSPDWGRERFTLDQEASEVVKETFIKLYEAGLLYKDMRLGYWDPVFQSALSDVEVETKEEPGFMYHIHYACADPLEKEVSGIIIATTRPETLFGDVAVAVHPEDIRYQHLIGKELIVPLINRKIPIIADLHADPLKGSGAVKITPAHDFNDYEVGKRHDLPELSVFDSQGRLNEEVPQKYQGLDRFVARKQVIKDLEEQGLLIKSEEQMIALPRGDRSKAILEPRLTTQWYIDMRPLAQEALERLEQGEYSFRPQNQEKIFRRWLENIQPWCVSRQLWWGHRIPAWYPLGLKSGEKQKVFVAKTELEAQTQASLFYGREVAIQQEEDVLDTWFSSGLWPLITLGWPDQNELWTHEECYPTSMMITGHDILFFWVARMIMMSLFLTKKVPFKEIALHALVTDSKGRKMSKTVGNVINPLELIEKEGVDALRYALLSSAAPGKDVRFHANKVEEARQFGNKLWNAVTYAEKVRAYNNPDFDLAQTQNPINRWILLELARTEQSLKEEMLELRFDQAAQKLYEFSWSKLCDSYLEYSKVLLKLPEFKKETQETLAFVLEKMIALWVPYKPVLSEVLYARIYHAFYSERYSDAVIHEKFRSLTYPNLDVSCWSLAECSEIDSQILFLQKVLTAVRSSRNMLAITPKTELPFFVEKAEPQEQIYLNNPQIESLLYTLARIFKQEGLPQFEGSQVYVPIVVGTLRLFVDVTGIVDPQKEILRLKKSEKSLEGELKKAESKLNNDKFLMKAPESVVIEMKLRFEREQKELTLTKEALNLLSSSV